jgi:hypothetical protein
MFSLPCTSLEGKLHHSRSAPPGTKRNCIALDPWRSNQVSPITGYRSKKHTPLPPFAQKIIFSPLLRYPNNRTFFQFPPLMRTPTTEPFPFFKPTVHPVAKDIPLWLVVDQSLSENQRSESRTYQIPILCYTHRWASPFSPFANG